MPLGVFRIKRIAWFDSGSGRRLRGNVRIQRNAWFDSGSGRRLFGACRIQRNAWFDSGSGSLLVVNSFSLDDAYDSAWYSVELMKGKYIINYFRYQGVRCDVVWW